MGVVIAAVPPVGGGVVTCVGEACAERFGSLGVRLMRRLQALGVLCFL